MSVSLKNCSEDTVTSKYRIPVIDLCSDDESPVDVAGEKCKDRAKQHHTALSEVEEVKKVNINAVCKHKRECMVNQKMKGKAENAAPRVIVLDPSDEYSG